MTRREQRLLSACNAQAIGEGGYDLFHGYTYGESCQPKLLLGTTVTNAGCNCVVRMTQRGSQVQEEGLRESASQSNFKMMLREKSCTLPQ